MGRLKKCNKARQANGKSSPMKQLERIKLENDRIKDCVAEKTESVYKIIVTLSIIRSDLLKSRNETDVQRKKVENLINEKNKIKNEISSCKKNLEIRQRQKQFMINENNKRDRIVKKQEEELEKLRNVSSIPTPMRSPYTGKPLFNFNDLKDRRGRIKRCDLVVNAVTDLVGTDSSFERFLIFFFNYLNDSPKFAFRYQLSDEETFYVKTRFHLSNSFIRLFKKYTKSITGFDILSSRHDIAEIQRNISLKKFYEVECQKIKNKSLTGNVSYIKRPWVYIRSISEVLSCRLSTLAKNGRLVFNSATGDNICVSFGADKGGDETKGLLLMENVENPNDSRTHILLAFYTGNDDYLSMKKNFGPVLEQFNELKEISYNDGEKVVVKSVRKKVVGDIKFLCALYNHAGPSSAQPCLLCEYKYSNTGINKETLEFGEFDKAHKKRSLEGYKAQCEPLVDVDLENVVIPPLHTIQGILQKYGLNFVIDLANCIDFGDQTFPEDTRDQKIRLKEIEFEEEVYLKRMKAGCSDRDKLNELLVAFKKDNIKSTRSACSSKFCIAAIVNSRIVSKETYQCGKCSKVFHFCCNGIVTMDKKEKSSLVGNNETCYDCQFYSYTLKERIEDIEEEKRKLEESILDDQKTWEDIDDEKLKCQKAISDAGEQGIMREKLDKLLKEIGCENYSCSKNVTGNMARKFLRKQNIDKVVDIFPPSKQLDHVRFFLYDLERLMSAADSDLKSPLEIERISEDLASMTQNLRAAHPKKNVILKLHLVTAHLVEFLKTHSSWGRVTEQGVEHTHSDFKKLHIAYAAMKDPIAKGFAFVEACTNANYLTDAGESWNI